MGYSRLQKVTEWLQWVKAGYSRLPSGYGGSQQVTAGYRLVKVGYSNIETCNSGSYSPFFACKNHKLGL